MSTPPDEPLSLDHLLNSLGAAGTIIGGYYAARKALAVREPVRLPYREAGAATGAFEGAGEDIIETKHHTIKPTQSAVNPQKVAEYAERLQSGEKLSPIEVIDIPGKGMHIIEGHHRYVASRQTGIPIEMIVTQSNGPVGMPDWSNVIWKEYITESQFWDG